MKLYHCTWCKYEWEAKSAIRCPKCNGLSLMVCKPESE
jgi:DNA-directed RNA polymerase subunit RPC12/RpoP